VIRLPVLYPITDRALAGMRSHAELVAELCSGGARLVQVREKHMADGALLAACREAVAAAHATGARLIVNDRADVALLAGAGGVHLGDTDLPAGSARALLGGERWIGRSTHTVDEALEAGRLLVNDVDYVALGPIFPTRHAAIDRPALGIAAVARAAAGLRVPLVAIGGITLDNAADVLAAGAASVAVMGDLMTASDLGSRVAAYLSLAPSR